MHLRVFMKDLIILSSFEDAQELLEKRSAIYSSRPRFVLYTEMYAYLLLYHHHGLTPPSMGWERSLSFLPYGDQHRKHSRLVHEVLNPIALQSQRPLQEYETAVLLREIATTPNAFLNHIRRWVYYWHVDSLEGIYESHLRYSASLILRLTYGHRVNSTEDKYVQLSETAVTGTNQVGNGGSQLVDLFPARERFVLLPARSALKFKAPPFSVKYVPAWLPGMGFKRYALRVRKDVEGMRNMLFDVAKGYIVSLPQPDIHETVFLILQ